MVTAAETNAHYKKMYDRSSALAKIGVWECDLATEALTWTDGVYDLFELPRGKPIERSRIVEMYDEVSRVEMERARAEAIATGISFAIDILIRTARGNRRWLRLTADIEQEGGRPVRIFGTKQDITESRLAQEKVEALQAELIEMSRRSAMGTMAATLAHELNQPLASISNYAVGLRRALCAADPSRDLLAEGTDAIAASAARAGHIIRSLRALARGSAVKGRTLDAGKQIRDAAALALGDFGALAVEYRFGPDVELSADPVQFQQVMVNLIRNAAEAVQAMPVRTILVAAERCGDAVEISIEDSGPGIPADLLPNIFDAFVSTKAGGLGVGLAITRTIVETHGGRITAANGEGGGAVFTFTLPCAHSESEAANRIRAQARPARA